MTKNSETSDLFICNVYVNGRSKFTERFPMVRNFRVLLIPLIIYIFACNQEPTRETDIDNSGRVYVRNAHSRAYDENRNKVVLFGGAGISKVFGDTWEWTNYDWNRVAPVVKCQGHDTWEYDGFAWRKISISGPIARNHCGNGV